MEYNNFVFDSKFVIDGVEMESTPSELLAECLTFRKESSGELLPDIVDESVDLSPSPLTFALDEIENYMGELRSAEPLFPVPCPAKGARTAIAAALTECIWSAGHFRLSDVDLALKWRWNTEEIGGMAAFYRSVEEASQYLWDLGVRLFDIDFTPAKAGSILECEPDADPAPDTESDGAVQMLRTRLCPSKAVEDPTSWIIYVPFDTCPYRLGGSAFARLHGNGGDAATDISDPDYFIDCFEVVREMVEDGVAISGIGVGYGGLATAAGLLCGESGLDLDISAISSSYCENNVARILFGETPGVLLQIMDSDYDYVDSQFILQDVAYYTLGRPGKKGEIHLRKSSKAPISTILESLLQSRETAEGED